MRRRSEARLSRSPRLGALLLAALAALVIGPVSAGAVVIFAGYEQATTDPGTEFDLPFIPGNFLGAGCNSVSAGTTIALTGKPWAAGVPGDPITNFDWSGACHAGIVPHALTHCLNALQAGGPSELVDTVIRRITDGSLTPGDPIDSIDIELVSLSLVSTGSISVGGCNGGAGADFTVGVELDGAQTGGTLSMAATGFQDANTTATGNADVDLTVNYKVTFVEDGNSSNTSAMGGLSGDVAVSGTFTAGPQNIPTLSTWGIVVFGGLLLAMLYAFSRRSLAKQT